MEEEHVQALVRQHLGLRIGPEMAAYLLRQARQNADNGNDATAIPLIGEDARTGIPLRMELSVADLRTMLKGLAPDAALAGKIPLAEVE